MSAETAKAQRARATNAIAVLGSATPKQLADHLNAPRDIYPKLSEVTTAQAKTLLAQLKDG